MKPTMPTTTFREFAVSPPGRTPLLLLYGMLLLAMLLSIMPLVPEHGLPVLTRPATWLGPLTVLAVGMALTLAHRRRRIVLEGGRLTVQSTFYTRHVNVATLDLQHARIVDLAEHTGLKPIIKTNGYGLPGFMSGHFRMRDGSKAFCLLTDYSRVLVLPLLDGSHMLLSPEKPRALLDGLRQAVGEYSTT